MDFQYPCCASSRSRALLRAACLSSVATGSTDASIREEIFLLVERCFASVADSGRLLFCWVFGRVALDSPEADSSSPVLFLSIAASLFARPLWLIVVLSDVFGRQLQEVVVLLGCQKSGPGLPRS